MLNPKACFSAPLNPKACFSAHARKEVYPIHLRSFGAFLSRRSFLFFEEGQNKKLFSSARSKKGIDDDSPLRFVHAGHMKFIHSQAPPNLCSHAEKYYIYFFSSFIWRIFVGVQKRAMPYSVMCYVFDPTHHASVRTLKSKSVGV